MDATVRRIQTHTYYLTSGPASREPPHRRPAGPGLVPDDEPTPDEAPGLEHIGRRGELPPVGEDADRGARLRHAKALAQPERAPVPNDRWSRLSPPNSGRSTNVPVSVYFLPVDPVRSHRVNPPDEDSGSVTMASTLALRHRPKHRECLAVMQDPALGPRGRAFALREGRDARACGPVHGAAARLRENTAAPSLSASASSMAFDVACGPPASTSCASWMARDARTWCTRRTARARVSHPHHHPSEHRP
jgi:hypothetical protein